MLAEIEVMKEAALKIPLVPFSIMKRASEFLIFYGIACDIWTEKSDLDLSVKKAEELKRLLKKTSAVVPQLLLELDDYIAATRKAERLEPAL
jgi:hypothetical protein